MISIKRVIEKQKAHNGLLLIDGLNLAFRHLRGNHTSFAAEYISTIESLANSYEASKIIVLGDWGSYWRKSYYPEYKANREEKRKNQTPEDEQKFSEFLDEFNNTCILLQAKGYPFIRQKGNEADDLFSAIIDSKYTKKYDKIWIISSDRDLNLLLSDRVSQFSTVTRKEYRLDNWSDYYPFRHEQFIDYKILSGDAGDNVSKAPGVGEKRAMSLLEEYDSVWDMDFPLEGPKYIQNLNEFAKSGGLERNDMLMNIPEHYEEAINFTDPDNTNKIDKILGDYL